MRDSYFEASPSIRVAASACTVCGHRHAVWEGRGLSGRRCEAERKQSPRGRAPAGFDRAAIFAHGNWSDHDDDDAAEALAPRLHANFGPSLGARIGLGLGLAGLDDLPQTAPDARLAADNPATAASGTRHCSRALGTPACSGPGAATAPARLLRGE